MLLCITQLFSLHFDVIILILLKVPVVRLVLERWSIGIGIQVIHIREPHPSEVSFSAHSSIFGNTKSAVIIT